MGAALLPLKYSLVKHMDGKVKVTAKELAERLQHNYGNEKQLTPVNIEKHLSALRAAGLIEMVDVQFINNNSNDLLCSYKLTNYGQSRLQKYIPKG